MINKIMALLIAMAMMATLCISAFAAEIQPRHGTYGNNQETIDKTLDNGSSAYKVENSTHFNDNAFISQKSQELYLHMKQTGGFATYDERWI